MRPLALSACLVGALLSTTLATFLPERFGRSVGWNDQDHPFPSSSWSDWTPCTASCNQGYQGRHNCGYGYTMPDLSNPNTAPTPTEPNCAHSVAACNLQQCGDKYDWQPFGECNQTCGGGERRRLTGAGCNQGRVPTCPSGTTFSQTINCHAQSCDKVQGCGKADIVYVLDSSGSVGDYNWFIEKQFAIDVVKALDIGSDDTRVGVVSDSTEVHLNFDFEEHTTVDDLEEAIWGIPWMAGSTNTADGIRLARMVFQQSRSDVNKIMIVVTDGNSNILNETTIPQAELAKDEGILVFVIGMGDSVNDDELIGIGSTPSDEYVYHVSDFDSLSTITQTIVEGTCVSTVVTGPDCGKCLYSNGNTDYLPVPGKPCHFYMCTRQRAADRTYTYTYPEMPCGAGTRWDQTVLTCVHDTEGVCNGAVQPTTPTPTPGSGRCYLVAVDGNDKVYWNSVAQVQQPCGSGTVFSQQNCGCVTGDNQIPTCDGPLLYFPFDDDFKSVGCETIKADQAGKTSVTLAWDSKSGKSAQFDGSGVLVVPFMANFFANKNIQAFTVALWFKWTGDTSKIGGLVNNGNCETDPSFDVHVGTGQDVSGTLSTEAVSGESTGDYGVGRWDWIHVAEVYDGATLKLYVNGEVRRSVSMTGAIANTHCSLIIGQLGQDEGSGLFKGFIDELRVYVRALDDSEIGALAE